MSKILALAEEIDRELHEKDEQIKNLINYTAYLESELNNEKEKGAKFRRGLITLLSEYSNDDLHSW